MLFSEAHYPGMELMAKTCKAFTKRLKITRRGKVLARIPGQNHFNAKESRSKQLKQKGLREFIVPKRTLKRFMPEARI
ncbi:MAG: hypothetical protein AAB904_02265 [Patescibacteria group bacterium]